MRHQPGFAGEGAFKAGLELSGLRKKQKEVSPGEYGTADPVAGTAAFVTTELLPWIFLPKTARKVPGAKTAKESTRIISDQISDAIYPGTSIQAVPHPLMLLVLSM